MRKTSHPGKRKRQRDRRLSQGDLFGTLDETAQKMVLWIFQCEVAEQAGFALRAAADMDAQLQAGPNLDHDRFWAAAQLFLTCAANVSKLLWPAESRETLGVWPDRGEMLRASLNIRAQSRLAQKAHRNNLEHFDERLEKWVRDSPNRLMVDRSIGPAGAIVGPGPQDFMRGFDPATWSITFNAEAHPSAEVLTELAALYSTAKVLSGQPWWQMASLPQRTPIR